MDLLFLYQLLLGPVCTEPHIGKFWTLYWNHPTFAVFPNYFTRRKIILLLLAVWVIPPMVYLPRTVFMIIQYQSDNCSFKYSAGETIFGILSMIVFLVPIGATIWMYIQILANLRQGAREPRRARNPRTSSTAAPSSQESHQHSWLLSPWLSSFLCYLEQSGS